mgnify:CR=1 FL=1
MSKLMLIDATHPEETRVAVVSNGQIEDFDFESRNKRQLRGAVQVHESDVVSVRAMMPYA